MYKKKEEVNWADLQPELLDLIASKLSFLDYPNFKLVCSSWHIAAKHFSPGPLLMVLDETDENSDEDEFKCCFLNLNDKSDIDYVPNNKINRLQELLKDGQCVGSSHGWLVILDKYTNPYLLNPFSGREIELPRRETFPRIGEIGKRYGRKSKYKPSYCAGPLGGLEKFRESVVDKAILTANPSYDSDYKVIIMCNFQSELVFCSPRDCRWRVLSESKNYYDVLCCDNMLCALRKGIVELWDLSNDSFPVEKMRISLSLPRELGELDYDTARQWYLVLSPMRDIFVVERMYIEVDNFVDQYSKIVNGKWKWEDEVSDDDNGKWEDDKPDSVTFSRSVGLEFRIYKVDLDEGKSLEVKSVNDLALFLGGSQNMCVSVKDCRGLKGNTIYFTDDFWDWIGEDYLYWGYHIGIFNLEDGSIDSLLDLFNIEARSIHSFPHLERIFAEAPFWVFPESRYASVANCT